MSAHHCHALGCKRYCPPRWLMCPAHWSMVPKDLQSEIYRTVGLRDKEYIDASWAPWWRAQAKAIAHVAFIEHPDAVKRDRYLTNSFKFADELEEGGLKRR